MSESMGRYVKDARGKTKGMFDADERLSSMSVDPEPRRRSAPTPPQTPPKPATGKKYGKTS